MKLFRNSLVVMFLLALGLTARANTINLSLSSVTPNAVGPFAQFTYSAALGGDSVLHSGDYFVIYDFNGFAGFGTTFGSPTGTFIGTTGLWNATLSVVGPDPVGTGTPAGVGVIRMPASDTGLLNLVFTYVGPDVVSPPITSLVTVSALSGNSAKTSGEYGSQDHASDTNLLQGSIQGVSVPGPGGPNDFLPTPAAATGGLALIGLLGVSRRRK